jgi:hypothetical protein
MPSEDIHPTPPLRIRHLFLCMTALALVGTWRLALNDYIAGLPAEYRSSNSSATTLRISSVQTVAWGGMVAITLLGVAWKWRNKRWRWPPGLWLAAYGTVEFLDSFVKTLPNWLSNRVEHGVYHIPIYRDFAYEFIGGVALGWIAIRATLKRRWRVAFGLLALRWLLYAACAGGLILGSLFGPRETRPVGDWYWSIASVARYAYFAGVSAVIVAAIVDLYGSSRPGWAHWAGVLLWLLYSLVIYVIPWVLATYGYY